MKQKVYIYIYNNSLKVQAEPMFRRCNLQTLLMKSLLDARLNENDLQWEISQSVSLAI